MSYNSDHSNIKFIFFDLDDTLLDHTRAEQRALSDVFQYFGWKSRGITEEQLIDTFHRINRKLWKRYGNGEITKEKLQRRRIEETLSQLALNDEKWKQVGAYYLERYEKRWCWLEGGEALLTQAAEKRPLGLLTNGFTELQRRKFDRFKFRYFVKHFIISEEIGAMKPQPAVFDYATHKTGFKPHEILYIGDSIHSDVEGGTRANWHVIWFDRFNRKTPVDAACFTYTAPEELSRWMNEML